MKKLNRKGFTLIELLAVITIMGILMLVAIPAVSRTIENSRRDTFGDVAKSYLNAVRNSILADEFKCETGVADKYETVSATGEGTYFFKISSEDPDSDSNQIMESGGKSSWGNAEVEGYVKWIKDTDDTNEEAGQMTKITYSILLVDTASHGLDEETSENDITRTSVKTKADFKVGGVTYPTSSNEVHECKLK